MGCHLLLEDGSGAILLEDGASYLLQDGCTPSGTPTVETPQGGFVHVVPRRRLVIPNVRIPLDDEEDEAVALALLQAIRDRRKLG